MSSPIVVVGSLNMDLVIRTLRHPQPGETLLGSNFQTFPGGKGANQAVAAARLGGQVRMIGRVGMDAFGETLLENLIRDGIDTTFVRKTPETASGVALITLDAVGQNTIVVASGANGLLTPQDIQESSAAFDGAAAVLLQLETPLETVAYAIDLARKKKVRVVLNPAPARSLDEKLLKQVDFLVPNQNELALLTGVQDIELAANSMIGLVTGAVIVTLGGDGVLIVQKKNKSQHILAYTVPVVDTVAAGDAFVGAFVLGLAEGKNMRDAAMFGNAAGAIAVTHPGAQPSLPNRLELDRFLGVTQSTYRAY
jgi:ribokinase